MGNSSTKGQGQYPSITTLQRELFEERWRSTLAKSLAGPIFTELPLTLGAALTQILYARVSGRGQSGLKAELLNLLNSAVTFDLADLVIALHSEAGLSLTELAGQVSKLFLSMWGEPLSQSEQGTAAFRDLLLLSHWRPGQLEVEDQYIIEWLNCCKQNNIDAKRLEGWISTNHQFQNVFSVVIKRALLGPSAIDDADFSAPLVVGGTLNAALCWLVMKNVPVDCHPTWNLRYASKVHGASWNAFRRAVTKAGPSIIVIRGEGEIRDPPYVWRLQLRRLGHLPKVFWGREVVPLYDLSPTEGVPPDGIQLQLSIFQPWGSNPPQR
ncbi:hypothetical protein L0F63_007318 [Massospora cicadina]|nr:hypothetical protein L0F63_007318 [Massospora cicadina]